MANLPTTILTNLLTPFARFRKNVSPQCNATCDVINMALWLGLLFFYLSHFQDIFLIWHTTKSINDYSPTDYNYELTITNLLTLLT